MRPVGDKAYFHAETVAACKQRGWFLSAAYKRHRYETETTEPTLYNRFVLVMRQPLEEFVRPTGSENGFAERFVRSFEPEVESALRRQARRRLLATHFLLLIRIIKYIMSVEASRFYIKAISE